MALVNVTNIEVNNTPSSFTDPISLGITFETTKNLQEEDCIEWILTYVGSAKDETYDIILDQFSMGPLDEGTMQFTVESEAPDYKKIPSQDDLLGITAVILSVKYKEQEFFRVGYYVYNDYSDPELKENRPEEVQIDKIQRSILKDKPRITRFDIDWGDGGLTKQFQQDNQNKQMDPNEKEYQFYYGSNNNSVSNLNEGQGNGQKGVNSVSFGMFNNQNTLQEVNSHFQDLAKQASFNNENSNNFQQQQFQQPANKEIELENQQQQNQQQSNGENAFQQEQGLF